MQLTNPMASNQALLRTSLLPGLARIIARNVALDVDGARVFELGGCSCRGAGAALPEEPRIIGVAAHRGGGSQPAAALRDAILEVKGFFELLTETLSASELSAEQVAVAGFHPG